MDIEQMKDFVRSVWGWIAWAFSALRSSLVAFVASPKVWLAAGLFAFLGYYGGFLVGARHVPYLKTELKLAHEARKRTTMRNIELVSALGTMREELEQARKALAKPAPVARKKAPAAVAVRP